MIVAWVFLILIPFPTHMHDPPPPEGMVHLIDAFINLSTFAMRNSLTCTCVAMILLYKAWPNNLIIDLGLIMIPLAGLTRYSFVLFHVAQHLWHWTTFTSLEYDNRRALSVMIPSLFVSSLTIACLGMALKTAASSKYHLIDKKE